MSEVSIFLQKLPIIKKLMPIPRIVREQIPRGQGKLLFIMAIFVIPTLFFVSWLQLASFQRTLETLVQFGLPMLLMAWAAGLIIAAGNVDISLAGTATLSGMVFALMINFFSLDQIPVWTDLAKASLYACIVGLIVGLINGIFVAYRRAPALLVTWCTGTITYALAGLFAYGLHTKMGLTSSPSGISVPQLRVVFDITRLSYLFCMIGLVVAFAILIFRLGPIARAIGANKKSMSSAGFYVNRAITSEFVVAAVIASITGCLWVVAQGSINTTDHTETSMIAIAIAVLGGTALSGGYFSPFGIFLATIVWMQLTNNFAGSTIFSDAAGIQESRITGSIFALIVLVAAIWLGKQMSGEIRTVQVDDSEQRAML